MRWLLLVFLGLVGASLPPARAQGAPFAMNGWQLHEREVVKLEEAIGQAPKYGVNFLVLSHELFRSVEDFLASQEHRRDLLHVGRLAQQKGLAYYLWIHELDDIPARFREGKRVNLDHPGLFPYLRDRYERLLKAVPDTAGFVFTLHESGAKIFDDTEVKSSQPIAERIYRVTRLIYDVAARHGKKMMVRNFFYEPQEIAAFAQALGRLPDDVIVMNKDTPHEFDPFYPPDPMHGKVGRKRQIVEADLGVEKAMSKQGAYAQVDYIRRYVKRAKDLKLAGMMGRARFYWDRPFEDSHEINLYAFHRFMANPDLPSDVVFRDWAARRFPAPAVPYIVSAMRRTEYINHHGRYFLGEWLTKWIGDQWHNYPYYYGHLLERARYKWTQDPSHKKLQEAMYAPDRALFDRLVAEKDQVLAQVRASIDDLAMAKRYVPAPQIAGLEEDFRFLLDAAKLMREWTRAYFAQRMFMREPSEEHEMMTLDALAKLEALERTPGVTYGLNPRTGRRYNIDRFALEMRWRLANRGRALQEDERILATVKRRTEESTKPQPVLSDLAP